MSETLNDWFNAFVDLSGVMLGRLTELPVFFVTALMLVGVTLAYLGWRLVRRWRGRPKPSWRSYFVAVAVTFVLGVIFLFDQKLAFLQRDVGELNYYVRAEAIRDNAPATTEQASSEHTSSEQASSERASSEPTSSHRLITELKLKKGLRSIFSRCDTNLAVLNRAVEVATIRSHGRSPCVCYVAIVDLTDPGITIVITEALGKKIMTSAFARKHRCVVAINGEAGTSPSRTARLGRYTGICVSNGKAVLETNPYGRPFLSFDRKNRARYVREDTVVTKLTDDMYNVIWGRGDFLHEGQYIPEKNRRWARRNPRTLMGINAEGTRLILMIVDGRQRGYSVGLDLGTAAAVLKLFGTDHAMRCDQGGSSAMYLDSISGIVSRPSDGKERPTYTHLGIAFQRR